MKPSPSDETTKLLDWSRLMGEKFQLLHYNG